ncbi:DUF2213 domain-containing protein [Acinetobacter colistiniresistens]|uniref:DUF2213 domain-containing protein n=1 Tax=Acinetobacter colistiniresistens TaxID=280145 RepID=UPI00211BE3D4|nr:DUF2213 domain-containing protein [Acinetobacter colistiniresistens]UUM26267.1 DUF2213 domain-containing protein [Acinetobacter colistiniresistens]
MKRYLLHLKLGDFAPAQSTRTLTPEGFLLCKDARLGKAPQVRQYYAGEFNGIEGYTPDQVINVYSSAEELFRPETIQSYQGVDVTDNHPPGNTVNAATWKTHSIGTLSNVRQEGDFLVGDLLIKDSDVINQIQSQERLELSLGYGAELYFISGTAPDGTPYQAEFKNFFGDHIALVKYGRCGGDCRIGDQKPNPNNMEKTMQIIVNGIPFDVADNSALAAALKKDQDLLATLQQAADAKIKIGDQEFSVSELPAVQAVIDKVIADAKANAEKITTLEANQVTPEKLEALANERAAVITDAKKLNASVKTEGCSCEQIKREAITAKAGDAIVGAILGAVTVGDAKPEQVDMVFRALVATSGTQNKPHPLNTINAGDSKTTPPAGGDGSPQEQGYDKTTAWKKEI